MQKTLCTKWLAHITMPCYCSVARFLAWGFGISSFLKDTINRGFSLQGKNKASTMRQSLRCLKLGDLFQAAAPRTHGGGIFQSPTCSSGRRHREKRVFTMTTKHKEIIIWVRQTDMFHLLWKSFELTQDICLGKKKIKPSWSCVTSPFQVLALLSWNTYFWNKHRNIFYFQTSKAILVLLKHFLPQHFHLTWLKFHSGSCLQAAFSNKFIICHFHLVVSTTSSFPAGSKDANKSQVSLSHQELRKDFWNGHCLNKYLYKIKKVKKQKFEISLCP